MAQGKGVREAASGYGVNGYDPAMRSLAGDVHDRLRRDWPAGNCRAFS
jgi:hypothetical protein